eukprot:5151356-Amphidinium_carterae.1
MEHFSIRGRAGIAVSLSVRVGEGDGRCRRLGPAGEPPEAGPQRMHSGPASEREDTDAMPT